MLWVLPQSRLAQPGIVYFILFCFILSAAAHLPATHFMRQHPRYDFAWTVEYDARLNGHWGDFLNIAYDVARRSPTNAEQEKNPEATMPTLHAATAAPANALPDLITFWKFEEHSRFSETRIEMEGVNFYSLFMVWGGSRALYDKMHEYSVQGKMAYYEVFMPTIARHHGLKYVGIPHAIWSADDQPDSYHCCLRGAPQMYIDWFFSNSCTPLALMHPIKLVEDFWPL